MAIEERRPPAVGAEVRRWRSERGMTLANVAERTGLNVGYLSQIENDKASPSLGCLAAIGQALDVPIAWFFMGETPAPLVVRAAERPVSESDLGHVEHVDGRASRDISIIEITAAQARRSSRRTCPRRGRAPPGPARPLPPDKATTRSRSAPATTCAGMARFPTTVWSWTPGPTVAARRCSSSGSTPAADRSAGPRHSPGLAAVSCRATPSVPADRPSAARPEPSQVVPMKVGVAKETAPGERRVALVPEALGKLTAAGLDVLVERGAGAGAAIPDAAYAGRRRDDRVDRRPVQAVGRRSCASRSRRARRSASSARARP